MRKFRCNEDRFIFENTNRIWNVLAFCMSYSMHKSLAWGILHMILGYIYVLYWLFSYTDIDSFIMRFVNQS